MRLLVPPGQYGDDARSSTRGQNGADDSKCPSRAYDSSGQGKRKLTPTQAQIRQQHFLIAVGKVPRRLNQIAGGRLYQTAGTRTPVAVNAKVGRWSAVRAPQGR